MNLKEVTSSNVAKVGYDEEAKTLGIVFLSNEKKLYVYENVPINIYNEMIEAPSVGKYFHASIKDLYKFTTENIDD